MSWRAWTCDLKDDQLNTLVASAASPGQFSTGAAIGFFEGPTHCIFDQAQSAPPSHQLWSQRIFGERGELAARRLDHERERPWRVRWISTSEPPKAEHWSHPVELGDPDTSRAPLFGRGTPRGELREDRFRAALPASGAPIAEGTELFLECARHPAPGGALLRWNKVVASHQEKVGSNG